MRRCHGDLHLANIVLIEDKPVLFDAIEFDPAIASIDVLYDLAFPMMDFIRSGRHAAANALLNRYLEVTAGKLSMGLRPFRSSCRYDLPSERNVLLARLDRGNHDKTGVIQSAKAYFELARQLIHPPGADPCGGWRLVRNWKICPSAHTRP